MTVQITLTISKQKGQPYFYVDSTFNTFMEQTAGGQECTQASVNPRASEEVQNLITLAIDSLKTGAR